MTEGDCYGCGAALRGIDETCNACNRSNYCRECNTKHDFWYDDLVDGIRSITFLRICPKCDVHDYIDSYWSNNPEVGDYGLGRPY